MRRAGRSFGFRLAVAFAGVGLAAAAVTALLVNLSFERRFTGYLEEQQDGRARQLVAALAGSYERMGGWDTRDLDDLAAFALMDGGEVRLLDAAGEVVWQPASVPGAAGMAEMHRRMMGDGPIGSEQRIPVEVGGATVGTVVLRLPRAGLLPQDVEFRDSINRLLLYGGLAAGGLALLLGVFLARMATRPARELTRAARRLAAGEHGVRASHDAPDEFGEMARAFNAMADIVEEEDRLRRAFAADVAHELRTPLAILRTHLEAMQDGIVPTGAIELGSLHEEVLRLSRVVADLETLASADAASFSLDRRAVDVREVVGASIGGFADGFAREGIAVEATLEPAVAEVDPIRVRQILDNLLSNAHKFTPEGGKVRIALRRERDRVVLIVADTGRGIPAHELPHVFERFFRGSDARARGSGVGLTVVRELSEAHGGRVEVESRPGEGTTFTVLLPASSRAPLGGFTAPSHATSTVGS